MKKVEVCTETSSEMLWEEKHKVALPLGSVMQVALVQASRLPRSKHQVEGWVTLPAKMDFASRESFTLESGLAPVGTVVMTIKPQEAHARRDASPASREQSVDRSQRSDLDGADLHEAVAECAERLNGHLKITDKFGEYQMKYFHVREKRGIWSWCWYTTKDQVGTRPEGHVPFLAIQGVSPVETSPYELALKFKNQSDRIVTMVLQRYDSPRDDVLSDVRRMVNLVRDLRKQRKAEKEADISST
jgi:hypothetical protein